MASRRKRTDTVSTHEIVEGGVPSSTSSAPVALPPTRVHTQSYHLPLLHYDESTCEKLLSWFEDVEGTRSMPWRKAWIDPKMLKGREDGLEDDLAKRAYEVWVSEVSR